MVCFFVLNQILGIIRVCFHVQYISCLYQCSYFMYRTIHRISPILVSASAPKSPYRSGSTAEVDDGKSDHLKWSSLRIYSLLEPPSSGHSRNCGFSAHLFCLITGNVHKIQVQSVSASRRWLCWYFSHQSSVRARRRQTRQEVRHQNNVESSRWLSDHISIKWNNKKINEVKLNYCFFRSCRKSSVSAVSWFGFILRLKSQAVGERREKTAESQRRWTKNRSSGRPALFRPGGCCLGETREWQLPFFISLCEYWVSPGWINDSIHDKSESKRFSSFTVFIKKQEEFFNHL